MSILGHARTTTFFLHLKYTTSLVSLTEWSEESSEVIMTSYWRHNTISLVHNSRE